MRTVFDLCGDIKRIEESLKNAVPDLGEVEKFRKELKHCEKELKKIAREKMNLVQALKKGRLVKELEAEIDKVEEREQLAMTEKLALETKCPHFLT